MKFSNSSDDKTSNGFQTSELFNQQPPAANPPKGRKPKVPKPVDAEFLAELQKLNPEKDVEKEAQNALPPLLRGYLRLGAMIGDGAEEVVEVPSIEVKHPE